MIASSVVSSSNYLLGKTTGIGSETAKRYLEEGERVLITRRSVGT